MEVLPGKAPAAQTPSRHGLVLIVRAGALPLALLGVGHVGFVSGAGSGENSHERGPGGGGLHWMALAGSGQESPEVALNLKPLPYAS